MPQKVISVPVGAAGLSGVLLVLSFPKYGHPAVAFIALIPLLVALSGWNGRASMPGVSPRRGFMLGFLAGSIHFAGTIYWTGATVSTFGGLPVWFGVFVALLLAIMLGAFVGGAGAVTAFAVRRFGPAGLWITPSAWVTFEYLRGTYLFGGFPWIPLGNTMVTLLPVAQLGSLAGVWGLSWFVALLNTGFALAAMSTGHRRVVAGGSMLLLIAAVSVWGGLRLADDRLNDGAAIRVGMIQGNIAQEDKWHPSRATMILDRYLQLSQQAVQNGAQLLIWPESSTPFFFEDDISGGMVRGLARTLGVPLLLGSDEMEPGDAQRYYNSAFMLDTHGTTAAVYRKIQLVPFGEYVPLQRLLFFIGPLVEAVSAFSPGTRVTMLPVEGHMINTAICFEVTFPWLQREAVRQGSELLTTITNDAWYGGSSAPFQHFEMAAMRAIEQGRYLVRAANTGISGIVDPYGRVVIRTNLFETAAVVGEARFVQARTVYATIGDLAVWVSAAVVALALAWVFVEDRNRHAA